MYSAAYVSDFDSDDDEVVWPRYDDDGDDYDIQSVSTVELQAPECSSQHVYEFGEFEETHGWVQCRSRSQRDRLYFHNMHSGCDTWYRPISRHINVPSISLEKVTCMDDLTTSDMELMSVSDDENLPGKARDNDFSMKTQLNTLTRLYHIPQMNSISDKEDNLSVSSDAFAGEHRDEVDVKKKIDYSDNDDNSETKWSQFNIENFLETEVLVGEGAVNTEPKIEDDSDDASIMSSSTLLAAPRCTVFTAPHLKKIGFEEQIVKWQGTRVTKNQGGPRKIICEMYGVRTINYDLPEPNEIRLQAGVKSTRLSDSDSDSDDNKNGVSSSLQPDVITNVSSSYKESDRYNFWKDLRQPLLSDTSSSSSLRSNKSSSSDSSGSSTSCSSSMCSTCPCCTSCK
ncbi:uncharacterized protein LOC116841542 [Odontomachus brunneus]|uniref:uncharacterized protein LOC116841542 n=1 Tax=Odontomachus brunneus TaxID=486640 RepID=UPI0013F20F7B|nr:uncharacterized protein LOC116841542 [Odontomachus brunneus]